MKDMYGKEVNNGDWLVEGDNYGEVALFFKVENNKPVLKTRWGIGILEKFDLERIMEIDAEIKEKMKERLDIPDFIKNYYANFAKRTESTETEGLMLIKDINVEIMNKFVDEGHNTISYCSEDPMDINRKPIAYFPDKFIVGEY